MVTKNMRRILQQDPPPENGDQQPMRTRTSPSSSEDDDGSGSSTTATPMQKQKSRIIRKRKPVRRQQTRWIVMMTLCLSCCWFSDNFSSREIIIFRTIRTVSASTTPPPPPPPPPLKATTETATSSDVSSLSSADNRFTPRVKSQQPRKPPPPPPPVRRQQPLGGAIPPPPPKLTAAAATSDRAVQVEQRQKDTDVDNESPVDSPSPFSSLSSNKDEKLLESTSSSSSSSTATRVDLPPPPPPPPRSARSMDVQSNSYIIDQDERTKSYGDKKETLATNNIVDEGENSYRQSNSSEKGKTKEEEEAPWLIDTKASGSASSYRSVADQDDDTHPIDSSQEQADGGRRTRSDYIPVNKNPISDVTQDRREEFLSHPRIRLTRINTTTNTPSPDGHSSTRQHNPPPGPSQKLQNPSWRQGPAPNTNRQYYQSQRQQQLHHHRATRPSSGIQNAYSGPSSINRSPTSSRPQQSNGPLNLKKIWGKVEDALDKVASIEESVTDRAQSLAATVTSSFHHASPLSSSTSTPPSRTTSMKDQTSHEGRSWMTLRRQKPKANSPGPTTEKLRPYGQKFQVAREKNEQSKSTTEVSTGNKMNGMLLSKGGALSHKDDPTSPQYFGGRDMTSSSLPSRPTDNKSVLGNGPTPQHQRPPPPPPANSAYGHPASPIRSVDGGMPPNPNQRSDNYGTENPWLQQQQQQQRFPTNFGEGRGIRLSPANPGYPARPASVPQQHQTTQSPRSDNARNSNSEMPPKRFLKMKFSWKNLLPPLPPNPLKIFRKKEGYKYASLDAWSLDDSDDEDDEPNRGWLLGGLFRRKQRGKITTKPSHYQSSPYSARGSDGKDLMPLPISNILARSNNCQATILLTDEEKLRCRRIGNFYGLADVGILVLILLGVYQVATLERTLPVPASFEDAISVTLPSLVSIVKEATVSTWAPVAFLYAYLLNYVRQAIVNPMAAHESYSVWNSVQEDSDYAQLYMMMLAALPVDTTLPLRLAMVAKRQVGTFISKARLRSYTSTFALALVILTTSFVGQMFMACTSAFSEIFFASQWRSWPIQWVDLWGQIKPMIRSSLHSLKLQSQEFIAYVYAHPLEVAVPLSVLFSLIISSQLPQFEERRSIASHQRRDEDDEQEEDEIIQSAEESSEDLVRIGMSSASRLSMLPDTTSVEGVFERWYSNRATSQDDQLFSSSVSIQSIVRFVGYMVFAAVLSAVPIIVSFLLGGPRSLSSLHGAFMQRLDGPFSLSALQIYLLLLSIQAGWNVIQSTERTALVRRFLDEIESTRDEIKAANSQQIDLQAIASTSASAGIMVRDLWAAHTTKRVWAVRGANLECKNGEVVAVLGDDGDGRSKLLTTIAEASNFPPKRSLMTNKVRGTIAIGGVQTTKWNRSALKRRLGVFLSDVSMVSDWASLFSGWTIGEILQPNDALRVSNLKGKKHSFVNQQHKLTRNEKGSILLALKITGLYAAFQSKKLPSKLSTVLTARDSDLRQPGMKSQGSILSPGEWTKLLLTRILAQVVHDNDNVLSTSGNSGEKNLENSLIGSVLLLDDLTAWLSEVEEANLLKNLRRTGAATVFSSNKWSTGRFADRIYVVKDGAIVEGGTHDELLMRGPQQSLYAAKWHAMTMV